MSTELIVIVVVMAAIVLFNIIDFVTVRRRFDKFDYLWKESQSRQNHIESLLYTQQENTQNRLCNLVLLTKFYKKYAECIAVYPKKEQRLSKIADEIIQFVYESNQKNYATSETVKKMEALLVEFTKIIEEDD